MRLADVIRRLALGEARGDVELKTERGQVMPERVVQVARDAQPLFDAAALRQQRPCAQQFSVHRRQLIARRGFALHEKRAGGRKQHERRPW